MTGTINPSQIERELKITLERQSGVESSGTKTSLFNLVIFKRAFTPNPSDEALDFLLGKRPARIIHIDSGYKDKTRASVFARCYPDRKDRSVCFEEILISNGEDNRGIDPGTWSSLLIHDLPTYLWWLDKLVPPSNYLIQSFELGDKLLIHSSFNGVTFSEEPLSIYTGLSEMISTGSIQIPVSDFAWGKILPLRRFIAKVFDRDEYLEKLWDISGVKVQGAARAETTLLFLWLATRLGWTNGRLEIENGTGKRKFFFRDRKGREINLTGSTTAEKETARKETRKEVKIEISFHDTDELLLSCSENGCAELSTGINNGILYFKMPHDGNILLREVDSLQHDSIYYDTIEYSKSIRRV